MVQNNIPKYNFFIFAYWQDQNWKKFVGGTVKIWDLAHNLSNLGHEVFLFLPKYGFEKRSLPFRIVEIPIINFPILGFISFNIMLISVLLFKFFKCKPHTIYIRRGISIIPLLFSKFKKTNLVYEVNDNPYRRDESKNYNLLSLFRYKLSIKSDESYIRSCKLVCVITKEIRDIIVKKNPGIQKNKFIIIPSGSNSKLFRPMSQKKCRSKLKLDPLHYYIGFVGTLLYYSGVEVLIEAVPYIKEVIPNSFFLIIGEGPMRKKLFSIVRENRLQDSVWFKGQVKYEALPQIINSLDLCVAPYLKSAGYSSPVKIFDYMACAKAVIASKIDGCTDVFEKTDAIKLIEPQNPKILAQNVINLLKNKKLQYAMGKEGRKIIIKKYDRQLLTQKLVIEIFKRYGRRLK